MARPKFDRYFGDSGRMAHLVKIAQSMQHFEVTAEVAISRDATDDKFIALALDAGASILISGDPDLTDARRLHEPVRAQSDGLPHTARLRH